MFFFENLAKLPEHSTNDQNSQIAPNGLHGSQKPPVERFFNDQHRRNRFRSFDPKHKKHTYRRNNAWPTVWNREMSILTTYSTVRQNTQNRHFDAQNDRTTHPDDGKTSETDVPGDPGHFPVVLTCVLDVFGTFGKNRKFSFFFRKFFLL